MVDCAVGETRKRKNGDVCQVSSFNDIAVNSENRRTNGFESKDLEALTWKYNEPQR